MTPYSQSQFSDCLASNPTRPLQSPPKLLYRVTDYLRYFRQKPATCHNCQTDKVPDLDQKYLADQSFFVE